MRYPTTYIDKIGGMFFGHSSYLSAKIYTKLSFLKDKNRKNENSKIVILKNRYIEVEILDFFLGNDNLDEERTINALIKKIARKLIDTTDYERLREEYRRMVILSTCYRSDEEYLNPAIEPLVNMWGLKLGKEDSNIIAYGYFYELKIDHSGDIVINKIKIKKEPSERITILY